MSPCLQVRLLSWHGTQVAVKRLLVDSGDEREMQQARVVEGRLRIAVKPRPALAWQAFHCPHPSRRWHAKQTLPLSPQEASLMAQLRHLHIVPLLGVLSQPPGMIMEPFKTSLCSMLASARRDPVDAVQLTWQRRITMVSTWCAMLQQLLCQAL